MSKNAAEAILRIALPVPLYQVFDYYLPNGKLESCQLKKGIRVQVPFGAKKLVGILLETSTETDVPKNKLKSIIEILDLKPIIPDELFKLCQWAADYYHHPIGEVFAAALPALLRQGKKAEIKISHRVKGKNASSCHSRSEAETQLTGLLALDPRLRENDKKKYEQSKDNYNNKGQKPESEFKITKSDFSRMTENKIVLNPAQENAVAAVRKKLDKFQVLLLNGVTGSGKTEVYFRVIESILENENSKNKENDKKGQVLVLIPEIALTPQTVARFEKRFEDQIAVLHSGLTPRQRLNAWLSVKEGFAKIVIGTRSAIFTPFQNLGVIIIDEEHDASFKQQEGFRYSARDLAIIRASFNKIPIILGSATPSLESLHNAKINRYQLLELPERAGNAIHPNYHFIDIRNLRLQHGFSQKLIDTIDSHLKHGNQVLLFLNRRGYSPTVMCHVCGWIMNCTNCDARMTLHHFPKEVRCHHCSRRQAIPEICPNCHGATLDDVGVGTQRMEAALKKYFPHIPIVRIDRDTTKKRADMEAMFHQINTGHRQILIGTQMLAKGHHFPNVTLVGIMNADHGFFSSDFRAVEHIGQLLLQVSGRAGRAKKPGEVYIQTSHPHHPLLKTLTENGYAAFADLILKERQETQLPPFTYCALLRAWSKNLKIAYEFLNRIKTSPIIKENRQIKVLGPITSPMAKRKSMYHAQLLFQSKSRKNRNLLLEKLIQKIKPFKNVRWSIDVDPIEMY